MSEIDEKLSGVLDEYSNDQPGRELLDEIVGDVNLQYQLRRYQMIGDVMRHELPDRISLDLHHQIMAKVREVDVPPESKTSTKPVITRGSNIDLWSWAKLKPMAGLAVAASVAVVSVLAWQSISIDSQLDQSSSQVVSIEQQKIEQLVSQSPQLNVVPVNKNLNEGTRWSVANDSPALQQKLNGYLVNHTEYSKPIQGLIPQARVAGYDDKQ